MAALVSSDADTTGVDEAVAIGVWTVGADAALFFFPFATILNMERIKMMSTSMTNTMPKPIPVSIHTLVQFTSTKGIIILSVMFKVEYYHVSLQGL